MMRAKQEGGKKRRRMMRAVLPAAEAAINQWQSQLGLLPISDSRSEIKRARHCRGPLDNYTITCRYRELVIQHTTRARGLAGFVSVP